MHILQLESKSVLAKHLSAGTHGGNEIGLEQQQKSNLKPTMHLRSCYPRAGENKTTCHLAIVIWVDLW